MDPVDITVKAGKNKNIEIRIYSEEVENNYPVKYNKNLLFSEVFGISEPLKLRHERGYYGIKFYDNDHKIKKHLGINNKGEILFVVDKDTYDMLSNIEKEVQHENELRLEEAKSRVPLKFIVKTLNLRLLDMYYDAKVFVPNKTESAMTVEEKTRYNRLLNAVKEFNNDKYHLDGYIDAREYEEGQEFTLSDLENMFKPELQKYNELEREREERKKELERKRQEAIEEAKRTGKEVYIRIVDGYDGDEVYPGRDYGWVNVWEVATPDGKIIYKDEPTY